MREVRLERIEGFFRWAAWTKDSRGRPQVGVGLTKKSAIRELRRRLELRERSYKPRGHRYVETVEVDW